MTDNQLSNLHGVANHTHNGLDSSTLHLNDIIPTAPQPALTTSTGSPSSGGVAILSNADAAVINNIITRVNQIETALKNLKLLQ